MRRCWSGGILYPSKKLHTRVRVPNRNSPFLVLDLGFDIVDSIRGFDLKGDGLASKGLNENLHGVGFEVWTECDGRSKVRVESADPAYKGNRIGGPGE
jgi:hypothetical protein